MSDINDMQPIIKMENVSLRYGNGPDVLRNINLVLPKGSFYFLTGKSGAGKTSLLSMMYLAQKPTGGRMNIFGNNVNFTNRNSLAMFRRRIGVVFQDFRLLEHVSAFDNVALPLRVCGMSEKEINVRVNELLRWVEIKRSTMSITSTLSGGEKQRVAIARAVINRPDFLLADEPTGNVDSDIATKLMKLFVELNKLGTTVVIATHNENLIHDFRYPQIHLHNHGVTIIPAERNDNVSEY